MQQYKKARQLLSALAFATAVASSTMTFAEPVSAYQISPNVPLDSYMYEYIEKLDGLGYLADMQTGSKPYTRVQMAKWYQQLETSIAKDQAAPLYAKSMLNKLREELKTELSLLNGENAKLGLNLKEWSFETAYYEGDSLNQNGTKSTYQPLNVNNNGYRYGKQGNAVFTARMEGYLSPDTVLSLSPRFSYDRDENGKASLESGYIKTHISNISIQAGRDALWWGQGQRGSLLLTNNATPLTSIKISNIEPRHMPKPIGFLGTSNTSVVYSELETNRDIPYPSFLGIRSDFTPNKNFTFALAYTSILGGKDHMLSGSDYGDFFFGKNAYTDDKWNSIGGIDFRWRVPKWNGIHLYGELYGEDQATGLGFIPTPSKNSETIGVYIPRLSENGEWDAVFEYAHTINCSYSHSTYTDGYTYKGNLMGDAMGRNADRYYAKFTRYLGQGDQIAVNFEKVSQRPGAAGASQDINSIWLSTRHWFPDDLSLNATAGFSRVENKNFSNSKNDNNYILGLTLTKHY